MSTLIRTKREPQPNNVHVHSKSPPAQKELHKDQETKLQEYLARLDHLKHADKHKLSYIINDLASPKNASSS